MAVTIVRGGIPVSVLSLTSPSSSAITSNQLSVALSGNGQRLSEARPGSLDATVTTAQRRGRSDNGPVRDPTSARHLAEDVSDEIRGGAGNDSTHGALDPVIAGEHLRRRQF